MDAHCDDIQLLTKPGQLVERAFTIGKEQQRSFEFPFADGEAMLQIAMVILIRLRMDDDGIIDAPILHAAQQVLRRGGRLWAIRRALVIRKPRVTGTCEAMQMRVDSRT